MSSVIYQDGSYLRQNPTWHEGDSPWKATQILNILKKEGVHPRTIAEVGCGAGAVLKHVAEGFPNARLVGYDISPDAIRLCQRWTSRNLEYRLENILDTDDRYDVVLCADVFEHVDDYLGFLRDLRGHAERHVFHIPLDLTVLSMMRAGAIMRWRRKLGHLHYFTKDTALASLEYAGYRVRSWSYTRGALEVSGGSLRRRMAALPRKIALALDEDLAVRFLGGCSLVVLCESPTTSAVGASQPGV